MRYLSTVILSCLADMSAVAALCMCFCWMHCSSPWGKGDWSCPGGLKGVHEPAKMSCSFNTCSAWNGATARHLHHSGLVAEPGLGAELVLLWNTDMRGHAESRASPTFSSQPRPQDRTGGSALPQHSPMLPSSLWRWDSREARSLGMQRYLEALHN